MKYLNLLTKEDISGKVCLLRVDLNISKDDLIAAGKGLPLRITAIIPSLKFLMKQGAKVVILSHRGRPEVENGKYDLEKFSLKIFAKIISRPIRKPVHFVGLDFESLKRLVSRSKPGSVFMLENLRFVSGEERNDKQFGKQLASFGDFYVNDAFSASHRANSSVAAIADFLPSYAGLLLEKEMNNLEKVLKQPKKPFVVILGGAKIGDKIGIVKNLYNKADKFLIGGGIANTIFASKGTPVGNSLSEKVKLDSEIADDPQKKIVLPVDVVIENEEILDIGAKTVGLYSAIIKKAKTIIWNGPMGYIEEKKFRKGSEGILKAILGSKAFSVIGGGETTSLLKTSARGGSAFGGKNSKLKANVFVSTGGGAMLEYFSGKKMPGLEALEKNKLGINE